MIKADKEEVIRLDYRNEQHQKKLQQLAAALITWQQKAADEKAVLLLQVEEQVRCVTAQRMEAEEEWQKSIAVLDKRIKAKRKSSGNGSKRKRNRWKLPLLCYMPELPLPE